MRSTAQVVFDGAGRFAQIPSKLRQVEYFFHFSGVLLRWRSPYRRPPRNQNSSPQVKQEIKFRTLRKARNFHGPEENASTQKPASRLVHTAVLQKHNTPKKYF